VKDIKRFIGNRIRELRKQEGLSQEDLGWKAGLHYTYIGAIERGEKNCSIETLAKIAQALEVEIKELFPEGSQPSAKEMKSILIRQIDKLPPSIIKRLSDLLSEVVIKNPKMK